MTKLKDVRAFVGQEKDQRKNIESSIKKRYKISDFKDKYGPGYLIKDIKKDKKIYFDSNARKVLETRYLEKNEKKEVGENVLDLFARVSTNIAEADLKYDPKKDIKPVAEEFLESLVYKEFMPNTPTLCNAGRALQQLSACFVLPIEDYLATDDIGEDIEKQGNGIYDIERYMAMIHKSGGGTGFNFSHLRPRADAISTTFGSSSGPVSFISSYDSTTESVNQGGFRRGANMAELNNDHPDIFEYVSEKARKQTLTNFNLSVGAYDSFMKAIKEEGYFRLINPKGETLGVPLEKRIWKKENLLMKGQANYESLKAEIAPSLIVGEDGLSVINVYNNKKVGKIGEDNSVLISAKELFNYIAECAWEDGCPGIIFLDRMEANNKTPHIGRIESTNPCGEQPLLPFEACNLGAINLATCIENGEVNYKEIGRRVDKGVHFLDNVIDMSKFPFKKVYEKVHGTRKIGLGMLGWAEMLAQLNMAYNSEESIGLAREISKYITERGRKKSIELAKERGVFPYWKGSVWEKESKKVRNATITTIAPNGTTGMICGINGGIEPFFKLVYKKRCLDGKELVYSVPLLEKELKKIYKGKKLNRILKEIEKKGSVQDIEEMPKELKDVFKSSHDIAPEWHVKMQAAFQSGIDNAVSKTVNLSNEASIEDVKKIYQLAYDEGCIGVTIFRDGCKKGVYSGLEEKVTEIQLVQNKVKPHPVLDKKPQALKYKIKRIENKDSLHISVVSNLYIDDKNKKAYFIPDEIFQNRAPLGHATTTSFAQAGMDRTDILRGPNPDYAEIIGRLQSAFSNEEEGIGPKKIKSIEHAAGIAFEDALLRNGIVGRDEKTKKLVNLVRKIDLRKIEKDSVEYNQILSQVRVNPSSEELVIVGNNGKLDRKFICEDCGSEKYTFEAGCNHPKCMDCGTIEGGGCG